MKKILFGIALILFSMFLFMLGELALFDFFYNDFVQVIYAVLPFVGLAFSVWGLVEKENKQNKGDEE